jgi:alkylated DNA nucleotide flippase Atl1
MFGWFRRNVRKVEVFGVGVEFHPPADTAAGTPVSVQPNTPAVPVVAVTQQRGQKVDWPQLLAILKQRVGPGQVTTYGECSQWAFGNRAGGNAIRAMLEAAARRGHQQVTNRVVFTDGELGAAVEAHGQLTQLQAEGVPLSGPRQVDLIRCPPVVL